MSDMLYQNSLEKKVCFFFIPTSKLGVQDKHYVVIFVCFAAETQVFSLDAHLKLKKRNEC